MNWDAFTISLKVAQASKCQVKKYDQTTMQKICNYFLLQELWTFGTILRKGVTKCHLSKRDISGFKGPSGSPAQYFCQSCPVTSLWPARFSAGSSPPYRIKHSLLFMLVSRHQAIQFTAAFLKDLSWVQRNLLSTRRTSLNYWSDARQNYTITLAILNRKQLAIWRRWCSTDATVW